MNKNLSFLLLLIGLIFNTAIFGQPELDTTFNSSGKLLRDGFRAGVQDIAVQPDNKIVFVGTCSTINDSYNVCVGRLNEDGSADATFGINSGQYAGFALTRIPGARTNSTWQANGLAIQNDGKIVVAGSSSFGASTIDIVVLRYNSDGTPDTAFGTNGVVRTVSGENNLSSKVLIQPDGKIVLVGNNKQSDTANQQLIIRYNSDGTLDQTFSGDGLLQINIPDNNTYGSDIALQADGKILTGGGVRTIVGSPNPATSSMLIRLNQDGTFDTTFDEDGIKTVALGTGGSYTGFKSIAVQSDGRILGLAINRKLYRFDTNGSPDTSFDSDGSLDILTADTTMNGLTVTPSGMITLVGERTFCNCHPPNYYYHIARYLPYGSLDKTFSGDGFLEINVSNTRNDVGITAEYDLSGRIILGGFSATGVVGSPYSDGTWSFARLIATPTQNVGFSGRVVKSDGKPVLNAYITLKLGSEVIGVGRTNPFGYFRFKNIQTNQTYTLSAYAKNLNFTDRSVLVDDEIANYLIVGTK